VGCITLDAWCSHDRSSTFCITGRAGNDRNGCDIPLPQSHGERGLERNVLTSITVVEGEHEADAWLGLCRLRSYSLSGFVLSAFARGGTTPDLAWARATPHIAAVIERVGTRGLSQDVRERVQEHIHIWNREAPGPSRQWVEQAVSDLVGEVKIATRLALLAARAPYQIDVSIIETFQSYHPGDDALLGALAWASFTAARKIGAWLCLPLEA
jgi:hypothetical protein